MTHQSPALLPKEEGPLPNVEDIDTILEPAVGEVSRVSLSPAGQGNILGGIDCTVVGEHHNDRRSCGKYQGRRRPQPMTFPDPSDTPLPGSALCNNGASCDRGLRTHPVPEAPPFPSPSCFTRMTGEPTHPVSFCMWKRVQGGHTGRQDFLVGLPHVRVSSLS